MADTLDSWDQVVAYACTLPDVEMASWWGNLCPKVRGKGFVSPGYEPDSFHVLSTHEEKALLLETDPNAFRQTPHYVGWAGLLVRYGAADVGRVKAVIARAWWDRASKTQREVFGDRS